MGTVCGSTRCVLVEGNENKFSSDEATRVGSGRVGPSSARLRQGRLINMVALYIYHMELHIPGRLTERDVAALCMAKPPPSSMGVEDGHDERHLMFSITADSLHDAQMGYARSDITCFRCGQRGHKKCECRTWRTRMCNNRGNCRNGGNCPFAHSTNELRTPWIPRCIRVIRVDGALKHIGCGAVGHTFRECPHQVPEQDQEYCQPVQPVAAAPVTAPKKDVDSQQQSEVGVVPLPAASTFLSGANISVAPPPLPLPVPTTVEREEDGWTTATRGRRSRSTRTMAKPNIKTAADWDLLIKQMEKEEQEEEQARQKPGAATVADVQAAFAKGAQNGDRSEVEKALRQAPLSQDAE